MNGPSLARMLLCFSLSVLLQFTASAQKRWDGGAGDGQWSSALNWQPDGVPVAGEDVLIDNLLLPGRFTVTLAGTSTITVNSLFILPRPGDSIVLDIPSTNTAAPAIALTAAGDALVLGAGAILRNGSGAASGETLLMQGLFRLLNGARYIHRTTRANAYLIDRLAKDSSTTHGVFEFDVPGNAGYTVSLTGNNFGDLQFSATAAGGAKSYSGSGTSDLLIRGDLKIGHGAQLTSTLTADIRVGGDFTVDGTLNLQPVTTGVVGRSLMLQGGMAHIRGNGLISPGPNFRNIEAMQGSSVILQRSLVLPLSGHAFLLRAGATLDLGGFIISGAGSFISESGAILRIGDVNGLTKGDSGNLRTGVRLLHPGMTYIYEGDGTQYTGDALPSIVQALVIDKPTGELLLSRSVESGTLHLRLGQLKTTDSTVITIGTGGIISRLDAYGRSDEGWAGSHVAGPCVIRTSGIGTWRFPTGDGDHHAPVALRRTQDGEVLYAAEYHHAPLPSVSDTTGSGSLDAQEYWSMSASGVSPQHDAFIELSWRRSDWPTLNIPGTDGLYVAWLDSSSTGTRWTRLETLPASVGPDTAGWVRSDIPAAQFDAFTLGAGAAMSVLAQAASLHCVATTSGNALTLEGPVSPDREVHLEYSSDGQQFHSIIGNTIDDHFILDPHPLNTTTWYRFAFTHEGLPTAYSNTCMVKREASHTWKVYPQPAVDHIRLDAPFRIHHGRYRLLDLSIKPTKEGVLSDGDGWTIFLGKLPAGPLVLQVIHEQGIFVTVLVLQ